MDSEQDTDQQATPAEDSGSGAAGGSDFKYGEDESQDFVDRSVIDFDPEDGLYTGTAIEGDSDIPGPSEQDIREAQDEMGDDQGNNAAEKAAADKFIEDNDVDVEEAKKGEAIAGSAQGKSKDGKSADGAPPGDGSGQDEIAEHNSAQDDSADNDSAQDDSAGDASDERPKPYPHDGAGPDQ